MNDVLKFSEIALENGDRVAVTVDGKALKGRVNAVVDGMVAVTFAKDTDAILVSRSEVLPLYRLNDKNEMVNLFVLAQND